MKKLLLIVLVLLALSAAFAFESKSVLLGGLTDYQIRKHHKDDRLVAALYLYPQFGIFVKDNVCLDLFWGINSIVPTAIGCSVGGRYFFKNFYAGGELAVMPGVFDGFFHVIPKVGYLIQVVPNGYIDLQAYYRQTIDGRKLTARYGAIRAGVQVMIPRKPKPAEAQ